MPRRTAVSSGAPACPRACRPGQQPLGSGLLHRHGWTLLASSSRLAGLAGARGPPHSPVHAAGGGLCEGLEVGLRIHLTQQCLQLPRDALNGHHLGAVDAHKAAQSLLHRARTPPLQLAHPLQRGEWGGGTSARRAMRLQAVPSRGGAWDSKPGRLPTATTRHHTRTHPAPHTHMRTWKDLPKYCRSTCCARCSRTCCSTRHPSAPQRADIKQAAYVRHDCESRAVPILAAPVGLPLLPPTLATHACCRAPQRPHL